MTRDYDTAGNGSLTGWDRFGRVTDHAWRTGTSGVIDGYGYTYNAAGNRTAKSNLDNSVFNETYTFDGLDRLAASTRNSVNLQSWNLDPLGNWDSTTRGTAAAETRDHNAANEITGIDAASPIAYDDAGNMIADADHTYVYDAWNRLVKVIDATTAATVATYEYDGRNFRIERTIGTDTFDDYHNDGWQLLETQKNGVVSEQYVYDLRYIDSVVLRDRDTTANGALDERLYYAQDAQFNVTALVDTTGGVVERYAYTPYGERAVFTASWTPLTATVFDNAVSYTGQRLDAESGLHHFRNRYYSANLGRFITRDPLGYVDGMSLYGGYFALSLLEVDPSGLDRVDYVETDWDKNPDFKLVFSGKKSLALSVGELRSNYPAIVPDVLKFTMDGDIEQVLSTHQLAVASLVDGAENCECVTIYWNEEPQRIFSEFAAVVRADDKNGMVDGGVLFARGISSFGTRGGEIGVMKITAQDNEGALTGAINADALTLTGTVGLNNKISFATIDVGTEAAAPFEDPLLGFKWGLAGGGGQEFYSTYAHAGVDDYSLSVGTGAQAVELTVNGGLVLFGTKFRLEGRLREDSRQGQV